MSPQSHTVETVIYAVNPQAMKAADQRMGFLLDQGYCVIAHGSIPSDTFPRLYVILSQKSPIPESDPNRETSL